MVRRVGAFLQKRWWVAVVGLLLAGEIVYVLVTVHTPQHLPGGETVAGSTKFEYFDVLYDEFDRTLTATVRYSDERGMTSVSGADVLLIVYVRDDRRLESRSLGDPGVLRPADRCIEWRVGPVQLAPAERFAGFRIEGAYTLPSGEVRDLASSSASYEAP